MEIFFFLFGGRIAGELDAADADERRIGLLMSGGAADTVAA